MSELEKILDYLDHEGFVGETPFQVRAKAKNRIKDLLRETYNKALQAHFVDKTASSLDDAFEKEVEAL